MLCVTLQRQALRIAKVCLGDTDTVGHTQDSCPVPCTRATHRVQQNPKEQQRSQQHSCRAHRHYACPGRLPNAANTTPTGLCSRCPCRHQDVPQPTDCHRPQLRLIQPPAAAKLQQQRRQPVTVWQSLVWLQASASVQTRHKVPPAAGLGGRAAPVRIHPASLPFARWQHEWRDRGCANNKQRCATKRHAAPFAAAFVVQR